MLSITVVIPTNEQQMQKSIKGDLLQTPFTILLTVAAWARHSFQGVYKFPDLQAAYLKDSSLHAIEDAFDDAAIFLSDATIYPFNGTVELTSGEVVSGWKCLSNRGCDQHLPSILYIAGLCQAGFLMLSNVCCSCCSHAVIEIRV